MIEFSEPELADKSRVDAVFYKRCYRPNDYCFGNVFIWRKKFNVQIAFHNGNLLLKFFVGGLPRYLFPAGNGDMRQSIAEMAADAASHGAALRIASVTPEMGEMLAEMYPGKFEIRGDRSLSDYIYNAEDLIRLGGRKYHSKRNHITRFKADGDWSYEEITPANMDECVAMNEEWFRENDDGSDGSLKEEYQAIGEAFRHYEALAFSGGLLRRGGRVVAYTIGEQLCRDTFVVHIEKAFSRVEGAYTVINNEFVTRHCSGYRFINREEDMGDEGLRKAKLSYHPAMLLEKNLAVLREGVVL